MTPEGSSEVALGVLIANSESTWHINLVFYLQLLYKQLPYIQLPQLTFTCSESPIET